MAKSLKSKLSKLRHDGNITNEEYKQFIDKLDGNDKELWNNAIDTFLNKIVETYKTSIIDSSDCGVECKECLIFMVDKELKKLAKEVKK